MDQREALLSCDRIRSRGASPWGRLAAVGAALLVYAGLFYAGHAYFGRIVGIAAMIPILVSAHFFGVAGGLGAGLVSVPVSTLVLALLGAEDLLSPARIVVMVMLVAFGLASGVIREVGARGRRSEDLLNVAFQAARDGVWDIRVDTGEVYLSPRWFTMLGYEPDELPHGLETWERLLHPDDRERAMDVLRGTPRYDSEGFSVSFRLREKRGAWRWILARGKPVEFDAKGRPSRIVGVHSDISELKEAESRLADLAYRDQLTGLLNRKAFYERAEELIAQAERSSPDRLSAFLLIDLDNFKDVNDSFGHDIGDELLRRVAERLSRHLRKTDYLFRLGGDEFTVILTQLQQATDAALVASNLIRAFSEPLLLDGHTVFTALSIGIAVQPRDGSEVAELMRKSDTALHRAKRDRNTYRFYTMQMQSEAIHKMEVINSLRTALDEEQLRLHYQPIVDASGRIVGAEALIRWEDPERGLRMPGEFIDIAEETGLILRIGRWVLGRAAADAARWHHLGLGRIRVSVNVSPRQLRHRSISDDVELSLAASGLPPELLSLELTEGSFVDPDDQSADRLRDFRRHGITISIDDFGTGYSSMSYLKRLPVDTLKIDRSFVIGLPSNEQDVSIVKAIMTMARGNGLSVVAEGVDSREQTDFLSGLSCDYFQGYHFSRPVPAEAFEAMLVAGDVRAHARCISV
ncbi:MAG: putative bifunctional diguanylate cyclase/phosphodiesterase [Spirochaetota bacterium]